MSDGFTITQLPTDEAELQLQYKRILCILDLVIEKVKVSVCLPTFLDESKKFLAAIPDRDYIKTVCAKYLRHSDPSFIDCNSEFVAMIDNTSSKLATMRAEVSKFDSLKTFVDPHVSQVIGIVQKDRQLKKISLEKYCRFADEKCLHFIAGLKSIRQIMEEKSAMKAIEQINREKSLKRAFRENIEMKKHMQAVMDECENQKQNFQTQIDIKNAILRRLQKQCLKEAADLKEEVKHIVDSNEAWMIEDRQISNARQQELSSDAKAATNQYETLLSQHMKQERKMRAKRLKTATQLSGWLSKYDSDMRERQTELDIQTDGFLKENEDFNALLREMQELEDLSASLMAEKAEEDEIQRKAVLFFSRNRAAKIIQRFYRAYLARIRKRKKDKKKKK